MRVLVSAYACEPGKGSEPGVGWNWVKVISRENQVWVLTRRNNREPIEKELLKNPMPNTHFEYVDLPDWMAFWKKGQRGVRIYYYLWQYFALRHARQLGKKYKFDVGHHVTFVNDWMWTFFSLLPMPYVWGPVGSNARIPWSFLENRRACLFDVSRFAFQCIVRFLDPLFWLSALRAKKIILINRQSLNLVPLKWLARNKSLIEPAIGVEEDCQPAPFSNKKNTVFFYAGRFIPIKCPQIALDAFIQASKKNRAMLLIMLGEGPMLPKLRDRAKKNGVSGSVKFIPWLPRDRALSLMNESDVFLFPSAEGAGMVVLEALALGKPVVCLDFGGPGEFIDETCGIKVAVEDYEEVVSNLSSALMRLSTDHTLRRTLGEGARKRSLHFAWKNKGKLINSVYKEVLVDRSDSGKPA